jgi:hypothetical protein
MRKWIALVGVAGAIAATPATGAAQDLPVAACNAGTMNAHESIPETTGSGKVTPGHMAVPEWRAPRVATASSQPAAAARGPCTHHRRATGRSDPGQRRGSCALPNNSSQAERCPRRTG